MGNLGKLWETMESFGKPCGFMVNIDNIWEIMESHGEHCGFLKNHRELLNFLGELQEIIES